jgi:glyoxalase-like protein
MHNDFSRRDFLALSGILLSGLALNRFAVSADMPLVDAKDAFDHILVGSPNLESAIDWFETKTGVRPAVGGRHPGRGTRNALAWLGKEHYLELLAPDPEQPDVDTPRLRVFRGLSSPQPYTWAAAIHDGGKLVRRAAEKAGLKLEGPTPGSRKRPDGRTLEWTSLTFADDMHGLLPFFIQWLPLSPHPSEDSPQGCTLKSLTLISPESKKLQAALRAFGIRADIRQGPAPRLAVALNTPRGALEL